MQSIINHTRMKTIVKTFLLVLIAIIMLSFKANAQQTADTIPEYGKNPAWIKMIDNPQANYYETIKAFDSYFTYHKKPKDEADSQTEATEKENNTEIDVSDNSYIKSLSTEELNNYARLKYQVKRYENWKREMKPFVQEDGRILTNEERAAIWQKQQEEIKKQQK